MENDIILSNLTKNIISFCKYKYLLINKYKNKETLLISDEDNIDNIIAEEKNIQLKNNNNKYYIIRVYNDIDKNKYLDFYFIYIQSLANKNISFIESQIDELMSHMNLDKDKSFSHIILITDSTDLNVLNKFSKYNFHKDQILTTVELSVNIKQFITIQIKALEDFNNHVRCLLYNNTYEMNKDSQNTCLFTKLFFKVSDKPIQGLSYTYSNPVTGKQTEHRYYKYN